MVKINKKELETTQKVIISLIDLRNRLRLDRIGTMFMICVISVLGLVIMLLPPTKLTISLMMLLVLMMTALFLLILKIFEKEKRVLKHIMIWKNRREAQ